MRGLITFLGAVAAVPLLVVACGGDSDDGGSTGGSGGGLLGGAGGMSGSGGSTGGTSGSGGATGGTGGGITNECSPIPSKTAGSGGTDGGGVDSGTDASSGGGPADASVDGAATDGGPAPDAGTDGAASDGAASDGAASDGATSDGGGSDSGLPTIQCGSNSCTGISAGGLLTINPCCTLDGCGLNIESTVSGLIGISAGCYGVGQAGKADTTCPKYTADNPLGGTIEFPGCCRPDGECGFAVDTSSFGGPDLGCVPQECNGGPAKTCTP